jgi:hypothetical protein
VSYALVILEHTTEPGLSGTANDGPFPLMDSLTDAEGIFCMGASAWIFDTGKAIAPFAHLIAQASEKGLQLYVFHLHDDSFRSHVTSYPRSVALQEFLDT